tara:strand:- start:1526 stop:2080 length:555 start_codon:yes stop_codon:yes gene_type:complete
LFKVIEMLIRRVVTGHDAEGHSVFIEDNLAPRAADFQDIPGHGYAQVWSTHSTASISKRDLTMQRGSLIPSPGGASVLAITFPPDTVMMSPANPERAFTEMATHLPGLIDCFEPDNPGMHTTPTVDYGILLTGELWLELDGGEERKISPGDVVIQNATRHAWRNKSNENARMIFVMLGANSDGN